MQEIKEDIQMAREYYGDLEKALSAWGCNCQGNPSVIEILDTLYQTFPSLRHVGSCGAPQHLSKSNQIKVLEEGGLVSPPGGGDW